MAQPLMENIHETTLVGFQVHRELDLLVVHEETDAVTPGRTLAVRDQLSITIPLHRDRKNISLCRLPAEIVRVEENFFAARFLQLDEGRKEDLYQCLVYETRREIPATGR